MAFWYGDTGCLKCDVWIAARKEDLWRHIENRSVSTGTVRQWSNNAQHTPTALSHLVFALAQMVQAMALREFITVCIESV